MYFDLETKLLLLEEIVEFHKILNTVFIQSNKSKIMYFDEFTVYNLRHQIEHLSTTGIK